MNRTEEQTKAGDALADYLAVAPLSRALIRSREIELISGVGQLGGAVVDLGHGDGVFAEQLERRGVRLLVGLDRSLEELRRAKGRSSALLVVGDIERMPFRTGIFDGALSNCVLEHIVDLDRALGETMRILRSDGCFLATVVTDHYEETMFWPRFLRRLGLNGLAIAYLRFIASRFHHVRYFSVAEWKNAFATAGLAVTLERPYIGPRRQALLDLFLPFVQVSQWIRIVTGREVLLKRRWPVKRLRSIIEADERNLEAAHAANAFLIGRKSVIGP